MSDGLKLKVVESYSVDPWYNLSVEEKLLKEVKSNEVILYLWQNKHTVVIGRNQNPWHECKHETLNENGGKLARRLSGGGAVYHDMGNLNFTFIAEKKYFNIEKQLQVIIDAVKQFGIGAKFTGRNDITVDDKKFSGNAFYYDENRAYHHGTLLVNADIENLGKYLSVNTEKIKSKGIKSVKSRVVNLQTLSESITVDGLKKALIDVFGKTYSSEMLKKQRVCENMYSDEVVMSAYMKNKSWEWLFGQTPEFNMKFDKRLSFGWIEVLLLIKDSKVKNIRLYSDAMDVSLIKALKDTLEGCNFNKEDIEISLKSLASEFDEKQVDEIVQWFNETI